MENVQKVYITSEVAEMLNYQPVHIIRVAKSLLEQKKLTKKEFRSAGPRTYLFNEEAIKQLKVEVDYPDFFLTWEGDEENKEIKAIPYSELKVVCEDLIIFNDEDEKQKFESLQRAFIEEDEDEEYEEFIEEKQYLHEMLDSDDSYGWVSYARLEQAAREEKAYFIKGDKLVPIKASAIKHMTIAYEDSIVSEPVTQVSKGIFKTNDGYYYRFTGEGDEVETLDMDSYRMKYFEMETDDALKQIQEDFGLEIKYGKISYWENEPIFLTKNNEKINIKEVAVVDGMAMLKNRNISDILDDVERLVSRS